MENDRDPIAKRSYVGSAQLSLWVFICALLWIGSIISFFTLSIAASLGGLALAAIASGWVWLIFFKHGEF